MSESADLYISPAHVSVLVRRIWPICAFGQSYQQWQNANEIRQMRAHLANPTDSDSTEVVIYSSDDVVL